MNLSRALLLRSIRIEIILIDLDRLGVPSLTLIGSREAARRSVRQVQRLTEVGISLTEMDGELVPAVASDRTTSAEVAFVAGVEEGRVDGFVFSDAG